MVNRPAKKTPNRVVSKRRFVDDRRSENVHPVDSNNAIAISESVDCKNLIKRHEGFHQGVYRDTLGNCTAGWGHLLTDADPPENSKHWNDMEYLEEHFADDYRAAVDTVTLIFPSYTELAIHAQYVLVDMAFNLGYSRLKQFRRMFAALYARDYARAGDEMLDSLWSHQTKSRAIDLTNMMRRCAE